ncbi:MAG: hypothetical protein DCF31_10590 [Alphaproteobacteria bacterium]|nr:MAG: hypothetical protein DCF31_10590 [Alphaproteobacteria bacterium]
MTRIGAPAEPSPIATPGQDIRAGDIWPDIAGRFDILGGRMFDNVPALVRTPLDNDLQVAAARVDRPGAAGDARATTRLREVPDAAVLLAVRIAALPGLAGDLRAMAHAAPYDAARYDSMAGWAYGRGIAAGAPMAAFTDLVAAIDPAAAQRLAAAPVGSDGFRDAWRTLAEQPRFQALQDLFVASREAT